MFNIAIFCDKMLTFSELKPEKKKLRLSGSVNVHDMFLDEYLSLWVEHIDSISYLMYALQNNKFVK